MSDFLEFLFGMVLLLGGVFIGVGAPIGAIMYYSACRSADVYNAQHHATYTCSDFFWAGDQINAQTQTVHIQ